MFCQIEAILAGQVSEIVGVVKGLEACRYCQTEIIISSIKMLLGDNLVNLKVAGHVVGMNA